MKFYCMDEFNSEDYDFETKTYKTFNIDEGEMSAEEMVKCIKEFESVGYGVICIDHIDTETNTVYFYCDKV